MKDENHVPSSYCESLGLEYVGEAIPGLDYYVCKGNTTSTSVSLHASHVIMPKMVKIRRNPVVSISMLEEKSAFRQYNDNINAWHIPLKEIVSSPSRVPFHLNAYGLVSQGYDGRNATITLIDSCFKKANGDLNNLHGQENEIDGGNDIFTSTDGSSCDHGTKIWSLLTGTGLCTQGIVPAVGIDARVIPIENGELTDLEFARALHAATRGSIIVRTFNPDYSDPTTGFYLAYYSKEMLPQIVRDTIRSSVKRVGATYFVSAGNYGNNPQNGTTPRTCLDGSIAGEVDLFPITGTSPSGLSSFSERGCIAFAAPGGDRSSCFSANDGDRCVCVAGTSYSAPFAAGLAAILQQMCNNQLSNYDIYHVMVKTSLSSQMIDDKKGFQFYTNGAGNNYSDAYGFGLINYKNAVEYVKRNGCPSLPLLTSCMGERKVMNFTGEIAYYGGMSAPSSCEIDKIVYVRIYATFTSPIRKLSNWFIESPDKKVQCVILPQDHPYFYQQTLDIVTGCRAFYEEKYQKNGIWMVHFINRFEGANRVSMSMEFIGYK